MPINIVLSTTSYVPLEKSRSLGDGLTVQGRLQIPCASTIIPMIARKGGQRHSSRPKDRGLLA